MDHFDGLVWFLILAAALMYLQRRLHYETQAVFLLITRRRDIAMILFSLLFFPGVFLHELSHYLAARLLWVRTGRFSLTPRPLPDGRLQLGFVETANTDILRDALIGSAPLLTGGGFVIYVGIVHLGLNNLWEALLSWNGTAVWAVLTSIQSRPDFWLWFYLIVTVSSTMLPSTSDRRAWLPLALIGFSVMIFMFLAGIFVDFSQVWLFLLPRVNRGFQSAALIFGISVAIHMIVLPIIWGIRKLLMNLSGIHLSPG
jgi:hypothetical protein